MSQASDAGLLALHGLRLKGVGATDQVAEIYSLDPDEVEAAFEGAAQADFVVLREGRMPGWHLTKDGRVENERLLAAELDETNSRQTVSDAYERFLALNGAMLQVCTDWQVKDADASELNDHSDADYDATVIAELARIDSEVKPILKDLTADLARFGIYSDRFSHALDRVQAGEVEWFARPIMDSYHTVWFELHEDLLASLGIDRASEGAH